MLQNSNLIGVIISLVLTTWRAKLAEHGMRVLNAEPQGAAPAPARWPMIVQTGDRANISNISIAIGRSGVQCYRP
jgi:hypothetical protein